jgi:hypothetical protein
MTERFPILNYNGGYLMYEDKAIPYAGKTVAVCLDELQHPEDMIVRNVQNCGGCRKIIAHSDVAELAGDEIPLFKMPQGEQPYKEFADVFGNLIDALDTYLQLGRRKTTGDVRNLLDEMDVLIEKAKTTVHTYRLKGYGEAALRSGIKEGVQLFAIVEMKCLDCHLLDEHPPYTYVLPIEDGRLQIKEFIYE